jgi:hypothetical protein
MDSMVIQQVRHIYEVERLSLGQISQKLQISGKNVCRIINEAPRKKPARKVLCPPYERLNREWYQEYSLLRATQIYARLQSYGFPGSYETVKRHTRPLHRRIPQMFHELEFLPGEEAQKDWMIWRFPSGVLWGFVFLLAYSGYLFVHFYPRHIDELIYRPRCTH